jgi:leader peptidase (prepilin peptidase) / N-methyltransferase
MTELPRGIGAAFAFVFGASIGSFVNVVAFRLPRELSIIRPRSSCPNCGHPIPAWANIPILAYIGLRGRCLICGGAIPFRYFLTELGLAVAALYLYLDFPLAEAVARFVLCAALFAASLIDYDWRIIPHEISMPGIVIGFLAAASVIPSVGWKSSLVGIALGAGGLFALGEAYALVRRREGVGMGDVFLIGMVGAFLGWPAVLFTLFFGSIFGSIGGIAVALGGGGGDAPVEGANPGAEPTESDVSLLQTAIPFGPFLSLAAGIYALFQPELVRWYFSG